MHDYVLVALPLWKYNLSALLYSAFSLCKKVHLTFCYHKISIPVMLLFVMSSQSRDKVRQCGSLICLCRTFPYTQVCIMLTWVWYHNLLLRTFLFTLNLPGIENWLFILIQYTIKVGYEATTFLNDTFSFSSRTNCDTCIQKMFVYIITLALQLIYDMNKFDDNYHKLVCTETDLCCWGWLFENGMNNARALWSKRIFLRAGSLRWLHSQKATRWLCCIIPLVVVDVQGLYIMLGKP